MRSPHRTLLACLVALAVAAPLRAAGPLSDDEAKRLADIAPEAAADLAKLAATAQEWKAKFDAAKKLIDAYKTQVAAAEKAVADVRGQLNDAQAAAMKTVDGVRAAKSFDPKAVQALLDIVLPLAKQADLAKKCPPLQAVVDAATKVEMKVQEIEAKVKADIEAKLVDAKKQLADLKADADALKTRGDQYKQDVDALANLDEAQLRAMVEQTIRAKLQEELLAAVGADALDKLKQFQNPAKFARDFADGEFKKWLTTPFEITKEIKARVLTDKPNGSLFHPKTELVIEIEYAAGLKVQARGLVLVYDGTKAPFVTAKLDKPEITADGRTLLTGLLNAGLKELGGALPDGFPVSVTPPDLAAFKPGQPLELSVTADLSKIGLPVKLKGGLAIATKASGTPVRAVGKFEIDAKLPTPVPIPGTPLAVFSIGGGFDSAKKEVTAKAVVAPAATDKGVALQLTLTVAFPVKKIQVKGELFVGGTGGQSLGVVEGAFGEVAKDKYGFDLKLKMPGEGPASELLRKVVNGTGRLTVTQDGLTSNGEFTLYSVFRTDFNLALNANGSGHFTGGWNQQMCGVKVDADITARFQKGFTDLELSTNFNIGIDLGKILSADVVAVQLTASKAGISGLAHGFGLKVKFSYDPERDRNLRQKIEEALRGALADFEEEVRKALAQCDPFNKNSFAAYATRNLDPFNKNSAAARFTREFDPTNGNSVAGKTLKHLDPGKALKAAGIDIPFPTLNDATDFVGGLFGKKKPKPPPPPPPPTEAELAEAKFVTDLKTAVVSLEEIDREEVMPVAATGGPAGRTVRRSKVHVRALAPTLVAADADTFVIGFVVKVAGSASTVRPGKDPERLTNSQAAGKGNVVLRRQLGGGWKGKIDLPKIDWASCCYQDLSLWLSQEIERRLDHIPGVDVDGLKLIEERELWVENKTKSDMTVFVQRETVRRQFAPELPNFFGKSGKKYGGWTWLPDGPGKQEASAKFTLKAGARAKLTGALLGQKIDPFGPPPDAPLTARRVRIWAEADDGDDWNEYRDKDFWLVDENPKLNGRRAYQAETAGERTFSFLPPTGFRTFSERLVGFKNATEKTIRVHLSYQSTEDGKTTWRTLPQFEVKAGETVQPREPGGPFVRASAVRFAAVSEEFAFREHLDKPLGLVADAGSGVRLYKAEKVGTYTHTFHPAPATKPGGDK